jgi:hypothetical protein
VAGHVQPPDQRQRNVTREVGSLGKRGANIRIDGQQPGARPSDERATNPRVVATGNGVSDHLPVRKVHHCCWREGVVGNGHIADLNFVIFDFIDRRISIRIGKDVAVAGRGVSGKAPRPSSSCMALCLLHGAFCSVHRRRFALSAYNCGLHCNVIFWTLQLNSVGFSV